MLYFLVWVPQHELIENSHAEKYDSLANHYKSVADSLQFVLRSANEIDSTNQKTLEDAQGMEDNKIDSLRRLSIDRRIDFFADYVRRYKWRHDSINATVDAECSH